MISNNLVVLFTVKWQHVVNTPSHNAVAVVNYEMTTCCAYYSTSLDGVYVITDSVVFC